MLQQVSAAPRTCLRDSDTVAPRGGDEFVIIRSIIELGRHFGVTVIAEGVETAAQFNALREVNCDQAQGFRLGRPECTEAFTARLARAAVYLAPRIRRSYA